MSEPITKEEVGKEVEEKVVGDKGLILSEKDFEEKDKNSSKENNENLINQTSVKSDFSSLNLTDSKDEIESAIELVKSMELDLGKRNFFKIKDVKSADQHNTDDKTLTLKKNERANKEKEEIESIIQLAMGTKGFGLTKGRNNVNEYILTDQQVINNRDSRLVKGICEGKERGTSKVNEEVFKPRFQYINEDNELGLTKNDSNHDKQEFVYENTIWGVSNPQVADKGSNLKKEITNVGESESTKSEKGIIKKNQEKSKKGSIKDEGITSDTKEGNEIKSTVSTIELDDTDLEKMDKAELINMIRKLMTPFGDNKQTKPNPKADSQRQPLASSREDCDQILSPNINLADILTQLSGMVDEVQNSLVSTPTQVSPPKLVSSIPIDFATISSAVDATFWHLLRDLKLTELGLDTNSIKIEGFYSWLLKKTKRKDGLPSFFSINERAFLNRKSDEEKNLVKDKSNQNLDDIIHRPTEVELEGKLLVANKIEEYRDYKKEFFEHECRDKILDAMETHAVLNHPRLFNPFLMLSYPDIKNYKFTYRLLFPTLQYHQPFTFSQNYEMPFKCSELLSDQSMIGLEKKISVLKKEAARAGGKDPFGGLFLVRINTPQFGLSPVLTKKEFQGERIMSNSFKDLDSRSETTDEQTFSEHQIGRESFSKQDQKEEGTNGELKDEFNTTKDQSEASDLDDSEVEVGLLSCWSDYFASTQPADSTKLVMLGTLDSSSHPTQLGWHMQNVLYYVARYTDIANLTILSLRYTQTKIKLGESLLYQIQLPQIPTDHHPEIVGWDRATPENEEGETKMDLSLQMDPMVRAKQSVNLNLSLMKWRAEPDIDLNIVSNTRCLVLGAGTLGSYVGRNLLAWNVKSITFVDSGKVSFSNPVRQPLYVYTDCLEGGKPKAEAAAKSLQAVYPSAKVEGHTLSIPMPGHPLSPTELKPTQEAVRLLEQLIQDNDVIYMLTDSRESRWLPTMLSAKYGKLMINVALGFDTYVVMRHGVPVEKDYELDLIGTIEVMEGKDENQNIHVSNESSEPKEQEEIGMNLSCYFCQDVVAPTDSLSDRTLDEQCTVTRPGLAAIAGATAVELMISILQHPLKGLAPPPSLTDQPIEQYKVNRLCETIPHQLRGFLNSYSTIAPVGQYYPNCTACSRKVIQSYETLKFDFLQQVFNDPSILYKITGIDKLLEGMEELNLSESSEEEEQVEEEEEDVVEEEVVEVEEEFEVIPEHDKQIADGLNVRLIGLTSFAYIVDSDDD